MINETINASINATTQLTAEPGMSSLLMEVLSRFFAFISAPVIYPDMWWLLIHLILTFVLFEFYFERHVGENLGWSAALANSIVAIFISLELLRALYDHEGTPWSVAAQIFSDYLALGITEKTGLISLVLLLLGLGIFTAIVNYFHLLPKRLAFLISGHKTINLLAYFSMVAVWRYNSNNPLPLDTITLTSLILFGSLLWILLFIINHKRIRKRASRQKLSVFD